MRCIGSVLPDLNINDFGVKNEPVFEYLKDSKEQKELYAALAETARTTEEVPIIIGDQECKTNDVRYQVSTN